MAFIVCADSPIFKSMKSSQITIKDIARELGISPSTVSRALKDHPDISPDTKKAVTELAERLNYQPNSIALSLRQSKTNMIGVVIPEIVHFFFSTVISGIEDIAYDAGYNVIVSQSNESYDREVTDVKALFNSRVDGMIASISRETKDYSHFESLYQRGMPLVFFDRVCDSLDTHRVVVDDYEGALEATEHLIEQGCTRIAHLAGPANLMISQNRMQGYKDALIKHGMPIEESLIVRCDSGTQEEAREVTTKLISQKPDAIFANNDIAALGAMLAIKGAGLNIPKDIALVGFSNWQITTLTDPALTTVDQPGFEMGQEAAKLLIRQIEMGDEEVLEPQTKVLKTRLIVRESSIRK
jgi:LacI family transcriptional regulator